MKQFFIFLCSVIIGQIAWADETATHALIAHLKDYQQASGKFHQTIDGQQEANMQSDGTFALIRAADSSALGKFLWHTTSPSEQLLIVDGKNIWFYEVALNQVTVSSQKASAVQSSPAMLLAGDVTQLSRQYNITENSKGGQEVFTLKPKGNTLFTQIKLFFSGNQISQMRVDNDLGKTTIIFSNIKFTAAPEQFRFVPPKNVDVLRN